MKGCRRSRRLVICLFLGLVAATTARAEDARAWLGYQEPLRTLREPGDVRWLSGPKAGDAFDIASRFLREHRAALRLSESDLAELSLQKRYVTADTGVTHLYLLQQHAGIDVLGASVTINVADDGSVINVGCATVPNLKQSVKKTFEGMPAPRALELAARHVGLRLSEPARILRRLGGASDMMTLSSGGLRAPEVRARLVYQPVGPGRVRLAWRLDIDEFDAGHLWGISVDAEDGSILSMLDSVDNDGYNVYEIPKENPDDGPRTLVTDPAEPLASPFGWHDTNGAAGAEFTITRGNNVHAFLDADDDETPDPNEEPDGGASLSFDFPIDLGMAPSTYGPAAVTNTFYWNNVLHDVFYQYGFDEPAGNFQVNNYGRGGMGGDDVQAHVQDGSGFNNAHFGTPPDGDRPLMRMKLWNQTTPNRDGDFDNGIITHEYGHGISNRLTCNAAGLNNIEQMGEGWSDFFAMYVTAKASDTATLTRGMGNYVLGETSSGNGIRPAPYTTNLAVNTFTYANLGSLGIPHGIGFLWATMLWEMYWNLVDVHGFDPDLYTGTGGNNLALRLVLDGLKLQPCSPGFVDGRDAILHADIVRTGGENHCLIWNAFAKRGLGANADQESPDSIADGSASFDLPQQCSNFGALDTDQRVCAGTTATYKLYVSNNLTAPVTFSASGHPAGTTASFSPNPLGAVPGLLDMTIGNTSGVGAGDYTIDILTDTPADDDPNSAVILRVVTPASVPSLTSPASGTTDVSLTPTLEWSAATGADNYVLEVDDDQNFGSINYTRTVTGTSHTVSGGLELNTTYFWRVRATNLCGPAANSTAFRFTTFSLCAADLTPNLIDDFDFESGADGWAQGTGGIANGWALSGARTFSGIQAWFATDPESRSDQRLVSPPFVLPTGQNPINLRFATYKHFETPNGDGRCWDGGILEISVDGGTSWTKLPDVNLTSDPYDNVFWNDNPGNNPIVEDLGVTSAWCPPAAEDWLLSLVNLDQYAGQTVQFRFRLGSDDAAGAEGWYIDDVAVQSCLQPATPTATATVTPTTPPTLVPSTPTPTLTVTPTSTQGPATPTETPISGVSVRTGSRGESWILLLLGMAAVLVARRGLTEPDRPERER